MNIWVKKRERIADINEAIKRSGVALEKGASVALLPDGRIEYTLSGKSAFGSYRMKTSFAEIRGLLWGEDIRRLTKKWGRKRWSVFCGKRRRAIPSVWTLSRHFAAIFQTHGWTWDSGKNAYVPSCREIRETILDLRRDLKRFKTRRVGAGRIEVFRKGAKVFVSIEKGPTFELGGLSGR